jgi:hypothetical protein
MINWEAVGAIGEVLGAIAVFVTLVYIAVQVRSMNKLLVFQHRETNRAAQFDEIANREFGELMFHAETDPGSLDEIDKRRVVKHIRNDLIHRQNMYLRGTILRDERVQNIAVIPPAQLMETYEIAREILLKDGRRSSLVTFFNNWMETHNMKLKPFLRPTGYVTQTKHLRSKCDSHLILGVFAA